MEANISLRKRIDDVQKKQNELLIAVLKQSDTTRVNDLIFNNVSGNQNNDCFTPTQSEVSGLNIPNPMNHYILGSQAFDMQSALSLLLNQPGLMSSGGPVPNQTIERNSGFSLPKSHELRQTVQNVMFNPNADSNRISRVLNVLTKEHQRNTDLNSFHPLQD